MFIEVLLGLEAAPTSRTYLGLAVLVPLRVGPPRLASSSISVVNFSAAFLLWLLPDGLLMDRLLMGVGLLMDGLLMISVIREVFVSSKLRINPELDEHIVSCQYVLSP